MDEGGSKSKCMAWVVEAICRQWHERLRCWWWWYMWTSSAGMIFKNIVIDEKPIEHWSIWSGPRNIEWFPEKVMVSRNSQTARGRWVDHSLHTWYHLHVSFYRNIPADDRGRCYSVLFTENLVDRNMRFNESTLKYVARLPEVQKEGRLSYKAPKEGMLDQEWEIKVRTRSANCTLVSSAPLKILLQWIL